MEVIFQKIFIKRHISHNTVVIDGQDQYLNSISKVNNYSDNFIEVEVKKAYQDCLIKRMIKLEEKSFEDKLYVKCKENKNIDYFFHIDGILLSDLEYNEEMEIGIYPYLKDVKKVKCNDVTSLSWKSNDIFGEVIIELDDKELYIGTTPDNPNDNDRTTILIRAISKECVFNLQWNFH